MMMKSETAQALEEFTTAFNQAPDPILGTQLIQEETAEVFDALLFKPDDEVLGELADLVYVLYWYAWCQGWDLDEAIRRTHTSNMSKLDDDGKPIYRGDGKVLKSSNYKPADMEDLV